uniref:Secreted protein n=1 Tax=Heterorhabditis bacteriophora TaxID=37862 RepID=A0A1I7WHN4_HETBA
MVCPDSLTREILLILLLIATSLSVRPVWRTPISSFKKNSLFKIQIFNLIFRIKNRDLLAIRHYRNKEGKLVFKKQHNIKIVDFTLHLLLNTNIFMYKFHKILMCLCHHKTFLSPRPQLKFLQLMLQQRVLRGRKIPTLTNNQF